MLLIIIIYNIVKNGKFGRAKEYLKKNNNCQIQLSFKLIENETKLEKKGENLSL